MIANAIWGNRSSHGRSWDPVHPRDPTLARMFGVGRITKAGVKVDSQEVMAIPTVLRGVSIIANAVMRLPREVYRNTEHGPVVDRDHFARRFIRRKFNDEMLASDAIETMQTWAIMRGNAVAWINRDKAGRPIDIVPLLPDRTGIYRISKSGAQKSTEDQGKLMYWTIANRKTYRILPENVLHIRGISFNGLWGIDIQDLLKETLGGDIAAREHGHRFFGGGATNAGFVTIPKGLDKEAEERLIQSLRGNLDGLGNAHKYVILEEGQQVTENQSSNKDSQLLELQEFNVRDIANVIRIQAEKVGDRKQKSYSSLESARADHKDDDIVPWVFKWQEEFDEKLLTTEEYETESHRIMMDDSTLEWRPLKDRVQAAKDLHLNNLASKNEGRVLAGQKPVEGEDGNEFLKPLNHVTAGKETDQELKQPSTTEEPDKLPEPLETEEIPEEESPDAILVASLVEFEIDRVSKRLKSSALKKCKSGESELISWIDKIEIKQGPEVLYSTISPMVENLKAGLNVMLDTAKHGDDLEPQIEAVFSEVFKKGICK